MSLSVHPLDEHIGYVADAERTALLRAAIAATVHPGERVADVGCGSGVLGLFCLQQGAGLVEAIDETAILEAARETFQRAGFGGRVRFHRGSSFRTQLPAPVDLIVCDHVGYFGFDYGLLALLADAKARFLAPAGRLMPRRLELFLGLVDDSAVTKPRDRWQAPEVPPELHWLRTVSANRKHPVALAGGDLLSEPARLDCLTLGDAAPDFLSWTVELVAARDGVLGGLAGWFRAELADGIWMTNAPGDAHAIDRPQALLPLEATIAVRAGDRVRATVMARPGDHVISWRLEHLPSGQRRAHSTLRGALLAAAEVRRRRPDRTPTPTPLGQATLLVLGYCDGRRSADEIEQLVLRDHPGLMPSAQELARFVAETLARYTE
jgi:protein arginine N-methyltransferase 1